MYIKSKFLKHKETQPHQVNSYGKFQVSKLYSRKKMIVPLSSEATIRANMQSPKGQRGSATSNASPTPNKHLVSGVSSKVNAEEKLVMLSSNLDAKLNRKRKLMAFTAKVVLWGVILYVLVLSRIPEIMMILSG